MLSLIAGETSDEKFLDKSAREKVIYDLLKSEPSLNGIHVAEIFSQPKTVATSSRAGSTPGLVFDMSRSCWT